jgi:predicted GTPase
MSEEPELKDIELVLNGEDVAAFMVMSCESIVTGLATLLNILQKRGIPDSDPEVTKMRSDYHEYLQRLELALLIQAKLREIKEGDPKPPVCDIGYA